MNYKIVKKGVFEREAKFEERLNSLYLEGWRAVNIAFQGASMVVLMEKGR